jgi:hypothetical protein
MEQTTTTQNKKPMTTNGMTIKPPTHFRGNRGLFLYKDGNPEPLDRVAIDGVKFLKAFAVFSSPMVMEWACHDGAPVFVSPSQLSPELVAKLHAHHLAGLDLVRPHRQAWADYLFQRYFRRRKVAHSELEAVLVRPHNKAGTLKDYEELGIIEKDGGCWRLVPLERPPLRFAHYSDVLDLFVERWDD